MSEILKLGELNEDEKKPKFTVPQFWKVISLLSRHDEINFDDLKFDPLFNGDASSINQLEHAGLLTILHHNGRPTRILSARPVFRVACQHLVADAKLAATMGIVTVKELIRLEEAKLQKWEIELERITASMTGGGATRELLSWTSQTQLEIRIKSLVGWIGESSKKLADLDVDLRALKDKVKLIK